MSEQELTPEQLKRARKERESQLKNMYKQNTAFLKNEADFLEQQYRKMKLTIDIHNLRPTYEDVMDIMEKEENELKNSDKQ